MALIEYIIIIVLVYLLLFFFIPLLILPNMLIIKPRIRITNKIRKLASRLKAENKEKTLKNIFDYVKRQYSSETYKIFLLPHKHFYYNVDKLIDKKQFLGCHVQCLVLRTLLLATGQFPEKELRKKIIMNEYFLFTSIILSKLGKRFLW